MSVLPKERGRQFIFLRESCRCGVQILLLRVGVAFIMHCARHCRLLPVQGSRGPGVFLSAGDQFAVMHEPLLFAS